MSIRNRLLIIIFVVVLINGAGFLFVTYSCERRAARNNNSNDEEFLTVEYLQKMMFPGGMYSGFMSPGNYTIASRFGNNLLANQNLMLMFKELRSQFVFFFLASIIIGLLVSEITARKILNPLNEIANVSNEIAKGNYNVEIKEAKTPELRRIVDSFRIMKNGLAEFEEEKERTESIEITKTLAAGIAHEIKNPINTVGLIVDYLQKNLNPEDPKKSYEFYKLTENMKNELKRINRIVEGFLRLTKPDVYNFKKSNVNSVIKETVSVLEPEAIKQNVRIKLELCNTIPSVYIDRDRMNQVFSNLIINSIEAMPRGGVITISTDKIQDGVVIVIKDTGIGIKKDNIRKIFSPYYTTKKQGFGLGLSLIHGIISRHRGKIFVSSEVGKGTEFTIMLPEGDGNEG